MNCYYILLKGNSSDESFIHESDDESSDDEKLWAKEVQKNYRLIRRNERIKEQESEDADNDTIVKNGSKLDDIKNDVKFEEGEPEKKKRNK